MHKFSSSFSEYIFFAVFHFYFVSFVLTHRTLFSFVSTKVQERKVQESSKKVTRKNLNLISWRVGCILVSPCTSVRRVTKSTVSVQVSLQKLH